MEGEPHEKAVDLLKAAQGKGTRISLSKNVQFHENFMSRKLQKKKCEKNYFIFIKFL